MKPVYSLPSTAFCNKLKQGFSLKSAHISCKPSGFSLIEVLIVISLFALVAIVVAVSYTGFEGREKISNVVSSLKGDLRLAQNKAITGDKVLDGLPPGGCRSPEDNLVGWYVTFDKRAGSNTSYKIVGNCLRDGSDSDSGNDKELDFGVMSIPLAEDVVINDITVNIDSALPVKPDVVNILFRPLDVNVSYHSENATIGPDPTQDSDFVDNSGNLINAYGSAVEAVIELASDDGEYEIKINHVGNIEEVKL